MPWRSRLVDVGAFGGDALEIGVPILRAVEDHLGAHIHGDGHGQLIVDGSMVLGEEEQDDLGDEIGRASCRERVSLCV